MQLQKKIGGAILTLALLLGVGILSSSTAVAQRTNDRDGQWGRDRDNDRRDGDWDRDGRDDRDDRNGRNGDSTLRAARNQGYQAGLSAGSSDAQQGRKFNPQKSRAFKNDTVGYNSSHRNRGAYKQAYRDGFIRGYQEGFQRNNDNDRGRWNNGRRRGNNGRQF